MQLLRACDETRLKQNAQAWLKKPIEAIHVFGLAAIFAGMLYNIQAIQKCITRNRNYVYALCSLAYTVLK